MFALFYERPDGSREFIIDTEGEVFANILARMFSRDSDCPIVAVENSETGETTVSCRYIHGDRVERTITDPLSGANPPPANSEAETTKPDQRR